GSPDGQTACGAALALAADPRLAVSLIEHPPSPVPEIRRLIAQLGSPLFVRRREAYRRLRELALTAEEELQQVAGSTGSVEVASRIRRLLDRLQGPSRNAQRELRQLSRQRQSLLTVRVLQWAGTPAARNLLERIADGKHPGSEAAAADARRALDWLDQADSPRDDAQHQSGCSEESASAAPASTTD
ncbi:MAG: hypothetical protein KDA79_06730, partial [Planctomycetaceae bacterium]|nr:hypothetical protein [Planctomycetaceae bacterium]